eukprot:TRINITY_DN4011_c0_g1_i2.p2 TRINITY_DN4011_c0_g1~~TRINITY_DN4011_c0_g1_i2.p2  ORF type:complete len:104 (-),score=7.57 TRINITY_DN4011_c0_g1_i2:179-490(-)
MKVVQEAQLQAEACLACCIRFLMGPKACGEQVPNDLWNCMPTSDIFCLFPPPPVWAFATTVLRTVVLGRTLRRTYPLKSPNILFIKLIYDEVWAYLATEAEMR